MILAGLVGVLSLRPADAQLAITEVLSHPAEGAVPRDDFWELTNFGTNTINLSTYWFKDSGGFSGAANLADLWAVSRLDLAQISPGESIVFVREQLGAMTTAADFRQWWGDNQLPPGLKIIGYSGFGFSSHADAVQLWQVFTNQTNLVQRVELFESLLGQTFTYDPASGALDTFSSIGFNGAFRAALTDDVGSPGFTVGPVALHWAEVPANTEVDGGSPVTLTALALGLPVPHYQWRFNGTPIPQATARTFTLLAATTSNAGHYTVQATNGLASILTLPATLTVNTQARCATIVRAPTDLGVNLGQNASFHVETRGYPLPTFQWQLNGVNIPGATASTFSVMGVGLSATGLYTVRVTNPLCTTNASARLSIVPVANLIITEAMSSPTNKTLLHHDTWWEVTNAGTNDVNLLGYRFDDAPGVLEGAVVVTNDVIVHAGQSAIFVSSMTPEAFRRWWGEEYLPSEVPIITYSGNGFSPYGDLARLWNPTATSDDDWVLSASFVNLEVGTSLWFDPLIPASEFGTASILNERGAFRAAESDDIGSPGWTSNAQRVIRPRVTSIQRGVSGVTVTWKTQPGRTYELRYRNALTDSNWLFVASATASGASLTAVDTTAGNTSQRFYKVLLIP